MKNKFRVWVVLPIALFIYLILSAFIYILMCQLGDPNTVTETTIMIGIIMLILFPLGLFLWSVFTMLPVVTFDEKGIHRSLFGLFKREFMWNEINFINVHSTINTITMWVFFSKSNLDGMGLSRCRLRRDNIHLVYSKELNEVVKYYSGKEIILPK